MWPAYEAMLCELRAHAHTLEMFDFGHDWSLGELKLRRAAAGEHATVRALVERVIATEVTEPDATAPFTNSF